MNEITADERCGYCGARFTKDGDPTCRCWDDCLDVGKHDGIWREPAVETEDYPGIVVHDGRVTGSMTLGSSRLPIWAFVGRLPRGGWQEVQDGGWDDFYGWTGENMASLLVDIFEQRGEFARLILMLADEERRERDETDKALHRADRKQKGGGIVWIALAPGDGGATMPDPWWKKPKSRMRIADQLRRCIATLDELNKCQ